MPKKPFIMVPDERPRPTAERTFMGNLCFWRVVWKPENRKKRGVKWKRETKHRVVS